MKRKLSVCFEENMESFKKLLVELEERPLIYINKIPSLKKISSVNVAVSLWNHFNHGMGLIFHGDDYYPSNEFNCLLIKVNDLLKNLSVSIPFVIFDLIRFQLEMVVKMMRTWAKYHRTRIFYEPNSVICFELKNIVWKCDGSIDYLQTATNMLSSTTGKTSVRHKYRLMCTYCIEEEIEKLRLLGYIDELAAFADQPLIYYWNSQIENEDLDFFDLHDFENFGIQLQDSDESNMITLVDNIYAIRYFWKYVSSDNQVNKARWLIDLHGLQFQDFFLRQLKNVQLDLLFIAIGPDIIRNYSSDSEYLENAWLVWLHARNLITEDQYQELILKLFVFDTYILEFLVNVWKTTPNHLKRSIFIKNSVFLNGLTSSFTSPFSNMNIETSISMLMNILPDFDVDVRQNIRQVINWPSICDDLIIKHHNPNLLDMFSKLCFANENEMMKLRRTWITEKTIERHCLYLINSANWKALEKFLCLCDLSSIDADALKQRVLLSESFLETCVKDLLLCRKFDALDNIIDCTFSCVEATTNFKNELFTCDLVVSLFFSEIFLQNRLNEIEELISKYLTEEKHVNLLKEKLMLNYRGTKLGILFFNYDKIAWERFLLWIFNGNKKKLKKFKKSINCDEVFSYILEQILENFKCDVCKEHERGYSFLKNMRYDFSKLDYFLLWYFNNNGGHVKQFKIDKITEFYSINIINRFVQRNDKINLRQLFKWFSSDDEELLENFRNVIIELNRGIKRNADCYY